MLSYMLFSLRLSTASLQLQKTWLVNYNNDIEPIGWLSIQSNLFCFIPLFLLSASIPTAWSELQPFSPSVSSSVDFSIQHCQDTKGTKLRRLETDSRAGTHRRIGQFTTERLVSKRYAPTLTLPPQLNIAYFHRARINVFFFLKLRKIRVSIPSRRDWEHTSNPRNQTNWVRVRSRARMRASCLPAGNRPPTSLIKELCWLWGG